MARQVLPVVGAIVGAYFGSPQLGWAIGSIIGNAIDPLTVKGPSIGEISAQTSQEGVPRPIVFARSAPIPGNIIATGPARIVKSTHRQGKGGPKVETESVFRTYAIGVCEGPITRFVRVWRNGTLKYDMSDSPLVSSEDNVEFLKKARFFLGGWDQNESPDLEAIFSIGTTPAHRGTAYLCMADDDLTDMRGAIPQYVFQVERCEGFYLTSRPYPLESVDGLDSTGTIPRDMPSINGITEAVDSSGSIISGTLASQLEVYDEYPPEALESTGTMGDGTLVTQLITYYDALPEALESTGTMGDGILDDALIVYGEYPPEALDSTGTIPSGSLA